MTRLHIIGIGNSFRGDDSVGALVVERLRERLASLSPQGVRLTQSRGDVAELMQAFEACEEAVLIDALYSSDTLVPGTVIEMDLQSEEVPIERLRASSHCLGVAESIELARVLDCLPATLTLWGLAGVNFSIDDDLSPPVVDAVDALTDTLWQRYFAAAMTPDCATRTY